MWTSASIQSLFSVSPVKGAPRPVAYRAVRPVAADQPARGSHLFPPVGVPQHGLDAVIATGEGDELDLPLDRDALAGEPFLQQPLGVGLREHEPVRVRAAHVAYADATDRPLPGED